MALNKGQPAIRAKQLWGWVESGTVKVSPLLGTRILIVARNSRPQVTWHRATVSGPEKHRTRYWWGTGVIFAPRWDPLKEHFDPIADDLAEIEKMSNHQLHQRGMYRLPNGEVVILIYQHVADALHFQRQQWHIRLESYAKELERIAKSLADIETTALKLIGSTESPPAMIEELMNLDRKFRERRQRISTITANLADRERAAAILIAELQREITEIRNGIQGSLQSQTLKDLLNGQPTNVAGLQRYLAQKHQRLDEILVRPIVRPVRRAQLGLCAAIGSLAVGNGDRAARQLNQTLRLLDGARAALEQPAEISELHDKAA